MRTAVLVLLAFVLGWGIGWLWPMAISEADSDDEGMTAELNGDVNGDGNRDLGDAVSLLSWLFSDGPEPVPVAPPPRFIDHGDGTVTDTLTGYLWQQATADADGDGELTEKDTFTKPDAHDYVQALRLGGHDDWRIPTSRELFSLVDYTRENPSIDPVFQAMSRPYWIGSTNYGDPCHGGNFVLDFGGASLAMYGYPGDVSGAVFLRAVRNPYLKGSEQQ